MNIEKTKRFVNQLFHIDANRINSKELLEYMNQLEKWDDDGVICLKEMSEIALNEASVGDVDRASKANNYIFTVSLSKTKDEEEKWKKISDLLFPEGPKDQNERNDVDIVFEAGKYGRILITNDGGSKRQKGILGNRKELAKIGIIVMTDKEACEYVKKKILLRDKDAILQKKQLGYELPDWVGRD
jgi:hypothetical protein